jgi:hypothetical protein
MTGIGQTWRLAVAAAALVFLSYVAGTGDHEVRSARALGHLQSQNIIRHPDIDEYHLVQQRNTFRARVDWNWVEKGKWIGSHRPAVHRELEVLLLYRGVYDSIYDYTPTLRENDFRGRSPGRAADRDLRTLEGRAQRAQVREPAARGLRDVKLKDIPVSFRLGKQQIIWGEADDFRMLDRANPLDTSWHYIMEIPPPSFGWDDLRIPLWMVKGLWDIGNIGAALQHLLEAYWNPGDWRPVKVGYLPRPGVSVSRTLSTTVRTAPSSHRSVSNADEGHGALQAGRLRPQSRSTTARSALASRGVSRTACRWACTTSTSAGRVTTVHPFAPVRASPDDDDGQIRTQR